MGKLLKLGNPKVHPIIEVLHNINNPEGIYPGILDFSLNKDNLYISEENISSELWKYSDEYEHFFNKNSALNSHISAEIIYSLNMWNRYKQIYRINENIDRNFIYDEDFKLHFDIFDKLPFDSIFIEYSKEERKRINNMAYNAKNGINEVGTFVTFIHNIDVTYDDGEIYKPNVRKIVFYDLIRGENSTLKLGPYGLREDEVDGKGINEIVSTYLSLKFYDLKKNEIKSFIERRRHILLYLINAILYICSDDITTDLNNQANEVKRNMSKIKNKKIIISEIGFEEEKDLIIVNDKNRNKYPINHESINESNESVFSNDLDEIKVFKQKRPHWRRAHWHYYRCGKGKKELRLKFILPILVNGENVNKKISTIIRNKYLDI